MASQAAPTAPEAGSEPVTFLFSDIEGSTRLWEQRTQEMSAALARHDALARAVVQAHGGHFVKTTGDGIHAAFDDAAAAVAAALALQLELARDERRARESGREPLALRVRCGLHGGPVERRGGDYFGPDVNRAARIMSVAHGGQTLMSGATAGQVAGRLPEGAGLLALGRVRLRDLSEPVEVLQLVHPQLREAFPALRSLESTPNNLAQQLDSFIGREAELATARELLERTRLLTLLGMGGLGKSRLSVQLAAELLPGFPDGVWLVELAPLAEAREVAQAVASVLGLREEPGSTLAQTLARHVRERSLLLVLDNCEHLVHAAAEIAKQLLQAGAGVKVLATSRSALQIAGERTFPLPPLAVPEPRRPAGEPAGHLLRHEAVRLFVERAGAALPAFRLEEANADAVAEICRRLDGIPLAIELAAVRVRVLAPAAIATRLDDRFRLLQTSDRTVLPRQRTLRALIDWSHELLAPAEQRLFRRLAVFAGGWTLEAADAVCADADQDELEVLELHSRLVQESLVAMQPGGQRYRMLDTVQAYAAEKLGEDAAEAAATASAHLRWCLQVAESAFAQWAGPGQAEAMARLDGERENLASAHRASAALPEGDAAALRLAHVLRPWFVSRGQLSAGLAMATATLARTGLRTRGLARCKALFGAGQLSGMMGRHAEAARWLGECLDIAREIGDEAVVARVLQPLGLNALALDDFETARVQLGAALELALARDEPRERLAALNAWATLHRIENRLDEAAPICAEVVEQARLLGEGEALGIVLLNAAMVAAARGERGAARGMLAEAAELAQGSASAPVALGVVEIGAVLADSEPAMRAAAREWFAAAARVRRESSLPRDAADEAFLEPYRARLQDAPEPELPRQGPELEPALQAVRSWLTGAPGA